MNKIFSLAKIFFLEQFKTMFSKSTPKKRFKNWTLVAIISLLVMFSLGVTFFGIYTGLKESGNSGYILLIGLIYVSLLSLVFFLFQIINTFFAAKDFDFLASLPLSSKQIISGKLIALLLNAYFIQAVLLLPVVVLYFFGVSASFSSILFLIIGFFVFPLFNFFICSLLALATRWIADRSRSPKKVEQAIMYILILIILFVFLFINNVGLSRLLQSQSVPISLYLLMPTSTIFYKAISSANWLLFAMFILLCVGLGYLTALMLSRAYFKFNHGFKKQAVTRKKKKKFGSSVFQSLTMLEIKRYLSSPLYVFNSAFGSIIMAAASVVLPIAYIFLSKNQSLPAVFAVKDFLIIMMVIIIVGVGVLTCSTNSSVSMEGKSFYFKKSLPIKFEKQMFAKIFVNLLLMLPMLLCFFTTLPIMVILGFYLHEILLILALILTTHVLVSLLGLLANLLFIRLDWVNETVIIKQSMSVFLSIMGGMLLGIGAIVLVVRLSAYLPMWVLLLILSTAFTLLSLIIWWLIKTVGKKKYEQVP